MSVLIPFAAPIFKGAAPGATTDIFADDLIPKRAGYSRLLITVQLATSSVFDMIVKTLDENGDVDDTLTCPVNSGTALVAGKPYDFEVLIHSDYVYNFQVETNSIISLLELANVKNG